MTAQQFGSIPLFVAALAFACLGWAVPTSRASSLSLAGLPLVFAQVPHDPNAKPNQINPDPTAPDIPKITPPPKSAPGMFDNVDWMFWGEVAIGVVVFIVIVIAYQKSQGKDQGTPNLASDVIGGYRLQNLMMTGQTSQVWEAVELSSNRHFAIKLLLPEKLQDPEHRQLLFHEAEVGMKLAHPNVIKMIKLVKDKHNPYFVMEYFPAGNLKIRIMHKKWDFIKEKAQDIFKQAATGLAYMNASGWVHRDVKPDNIMVNSAGEVRLIDFALAQPISKGMFRRRKGKSAGTRSYMSPEQIRGEGLDGRADVYSFGATMYEVITGRPPFRASTPTELLHKQIIEKPASPQIYNPDVTDECATLVLRMLAKKKDDRPKDFHEVLMQLRNIKIFKPEKGPVTQKTSQS